MNKWHTMIIASVTAVAGAAVGAMFARPDTGGQFETPQVVPAVSEAFPGTSTDHTGEGIWHVPFEAPPGLYKVTAVGNYGCTWKRLKKLTLKPKDEIASGTMSRGGFDTLVIAPTDKYFQLIGDCTIGASKGTPGDGR